jgi:ArsR family transcriptional regulator
MATPLYTLKAEFFRTLGHPARIRALELLSAREWSVSELVGELGLEASHVSQQLGVLRRAGLVTTRRQGSAVFYALTDPQIATLLAVARSILNDQAVHLRELLAKDV